jgi:hypothetical protein
MYPVEPSFSRESHVSERISDFRGLPREKEPSDGVVAGVVGSVRTPFLDGDEKRFQVRRERAPESVESSVLGNSSLDPTSGLCGGKSRGVRFFLFPEFEFEGYEVHLGVRNSLLARAQKHFNT